MCSGRLELGVGAGWFDREHEALGIDFPPLKERFDKWKTNYQYLNYLGLPPLTLLLTMRVKQ